MSDPSEHAQSFPGRGHRYQVAVVGAGPSGCEAAHACARAGLDTLLVTTSLDTLYNLLGDGWRLSPPADTLMERLHHDLADDGWVGTWAFHRAAKEALERVQRLHVLQSNVTSLLVDGGRVTGVSTWEGVDRFAERVVLAVGSFLAPRLAIGSVVEVAGKLSEMAYDDLYHDLQRRGFEFRELNLTAEAQDGSLPYTVRCHAFADGEFHGHVSTRFDALHATGLCVLGDVPFEAAAAHGRDVGESLVALSRT